MGNKNFEVRSKEGDLGLGITELEHLMVRESEKKKWIFGLSKKMEAAEKKNRGLKGRLEEIKEVGKLLAERNLGLRGEVAGGREVQQRILDVIEADKQLGVKDRQQLKDDKILEVKVRNVLAS